MCAHTPASELCGTRDGKREELRQVVAQDGQTGAEVGPLDQLPQRPPPLHQGLEARAARSGQGAGVQQHLGEEL
ncbi:hypothetical protein EYF80_047043 [Liparis tanakae]|uniref:Uncharacterized protein n=1 Tax=Liparis tanakae TaxID=230148 RepID=A0A4Z2FPT9_9TELE|nr:hypothetical protein EYF80_047043 [Liparis tanakae]